MDCEHYLDHGIYGHVDFLILVAVGSMGVGGLSAEGPSREKIGGGAGVASGLGLRLRLWMRGLPKQV